MDLVYYYVIFVLLGAFLFVNGLLAMFLLDTKSRAEAKKFGIKLATFGLSKKDDADAATLNGAGQVFIGFVTSLIMGLGGWKAGFGMTVLYCLAGGGGAAFIIYKLLKPKGLTN